MQGQEKNLIDNGYKFPKLIELAPMWTSNEIKLTTEAMAEEAHSAVWKPWLRAGYSGRRLSGGR